MKERSFYGQIQTAGFTIGYEQGRLNRKFKYFGWNIEFASQINPKAIGINWYGTGRKYVYGQLNSFAMLRGGYGGRIVLSEKPLRGGVTVSMPYSGGFSLGLAFPQFIYVMYDEYGEDIRLEKYNADNPKHLQHESIIKRGPLMKGVWHLRPYPGIYAKIGLSFEFGKDDKKLHTLEGGIVYDCYFTRIPLMMNNKNSFGFLNFFLGYRFGMKYGVR